MTADRNKKLFKRDLTLNYHPRGQCEKKGGCIIYRMWGDLDKPSNIIIPSVYFYPANTPVFAKNHVKIFGNIGTGRLEIANQSPRERFESKTPFLCSENLCGVIIEAPITIILRKKDEFQKVLLYKTLEFLFNKVINNEFKFLLGGKRTSGYGRAVIVKCNNNGNYLIKGRNVLGLKEEEALEIDKKFEQYIKEERKKFFIINKDNKEKRT